MSEKALEIQARYNKGFVTDEQLARYLELGAITEAEYQAIIEGASTTSDADEAMDIIQGVE